MKLLSNTTYCCCCCGIVVPAFCEHRPKSIVLFSDGTGNSASKQFKTNVWRTYQALDLDEPEGDARPQVAFYRDGVGTETLKPLAAVSGAFGLGVMRDVKALYTFLCRNYREGDTIYAFGFSRGAFTIRVLVGLVARCGLVQADNENQLFHFTRAAYKAYRREFLIRASEHRGMIYNHVLPPPCRDEQGRIDLHLPKPPLWPKVAFLGLWDTVDAYGMPIEELKQGIDEWIWPMSLADRKLSPIVEHACHALSLDDERPTFFPVLWDETDPDDKKRLEQMWFAGVHANVGGGYPIDDLSYVPLVWMLEKAKDHGLRFFADAVDFFDCMKNPNGTAYDSRSGVAGYYRYGPRSVKKLCDDDKNGVHNVTPAVHPAVVERIAARIVNYAPRSLPDDIALPHPRSGQSIAQNKELLACAWDAVFWRRISYFATLAITLFLVASPLLFPAGEARESRAESVLAVYRESDAGVLPTPLRWLLAKLFGLLPGWASAWVDVYQRHWICGSILLAILAIVFFGVSAKLQRTICERSEWAWAAMKGVAVPAFAPPPLDRFIRRVRMSKRLNTFGRWYDRKAVPAVVGALLLALLIWTGFRLFIWLAFEVPPDWIGGAVGVAAAATLATFVYNSRFRKRLSRELAMTPGVAKLPEEEYFPSVAKLKAFKSKAADIRLPDHTSLLESYVGPVLLPNDLVFALALGVFVILSSRWLAVAGWDRLAIWTGSFGLLYTISDLAEDVVLARVLSLRGFPRRLTGLAPWLTRAKFLCVFCSLTGLALFGVLRLVDLVLKPAIPSRF